MKCRNDRMEARAMDTDSRDLLDMLTLMYLAATSKAEGRGSKTKQVSTGTL